MARKRNWQVTIYESAFVLVSKYETEERVIPCATLAKARRVERHYYRKALRNADSVMRRGNWGFSATRGTALSAVSIRYAY